MVYSHPLYGRVPTALLTGRKQFPFHETIKIKLSVNSSKVTACNPITPEMRAVNPVVCHPTHTGLYAASHRSCCQNTAEMHSLLAFRCFLVAIAALPAMESHSRCSYLPEMHHRNMPGGIRSDPPCCYLSVQSPVSDLLSTHSSPRIPYGFPGENSVKLYSWQIYIHDFLSHKDPSSLWPMLNFNF